MISISAVSRPDGGNYERRIYNKRENRKGRCMEPKVGSRGGSDLCKSRTATYLPILRQVGNPGKLGASILRSHERRVSMRGVKAVERDTIALFSCRRMLQTLFLRAQRILSQNLQKRYSIVGRNPSGGDGQEFAMKSVEPQTGSAAKGDIPLNAVIAAKFISSELWDAANWKATTFKWHPSSAAPPIMGIVFQNSIHAYELFGLWNESNGNDDLTAGIARLDYRGPSFRRAPRVYRSHLRRSAACRYDDCQW